MGWFSDNRVLFPFIFKSGLTLHPGAPTIYSFANRDAPMDPNNRQTNHRTPGVANALWLTVLVLSLGLFGAGAFYQDSEPSPAAGFSGALDPVVGAPSSTELRALSPTATALRALTNGLHQPIEGENDGDVSFTANSVSLDGARLFSRLNGRCFSTTSQTSRHQSDPSPRAPPLV